MNRNQRRPFISKAAATNTNVAKVPSVIDVEKLKNLPKLIKKSIYNLNQKPTVPAQAKVGLNIQPVSTPSPAPSPSPSPSPAPVSATPGPLLVTIPTNNGINSDYDSLFFSDAVPRPLVLPSNFRDVYNSIIGGNTSINLGTTSAQILPLVTGNSVQDQFDISLYIDMLKSTDQSLFGVSNVNVPPSASLVSFVPTIFNQGAIGSCYANAAAQVISMSRAITANAARPGYLANILSYYATYRPSRMFIEYTTERLQYEFTNNTVYSQGGILSSTMQAIKNFGVCPENAYNYPVANTMSGSAFSALSQTQQDAVTSEFFIKESYAPDAYVFARAKADADMKEIHWTCVSDMSLGLSSTSALTFRQLKETIMMFIAAQIPLVFGFPVYANWTDAVQAQASTATVPLPTGNATGGHAAVIVGYDANNIVIANSWGNSVGNAGFFNMPWAYIQSHSNTANVLAGVDVYALMSPTWSSFRHIVLNRNNFSLKWDITAPTTNVSLNRK